MNENDERSIKEQLNRIERCLIGDAQLGHEGLVVSHRKHEKRIRRLERTAFYLSSGVVVVGVLYKVVVDWWPRK